MIFIIFLLNTFLSYFLMRLLHPLFVKHIIDKPNKRSLHKTPKPRGGGIVFSLISMLSGIFFNFYAPLVSFPLAVVGLIDDKFRLNPVIRLSVQVLTSISLLISAELSVISKPTQFVT